MTTNPQAASAMPARLSAAAQHQPAEESALSRMEKING